MPTEDDKKALASELKALRALPRELVRNTSTQLTIAAAQWAADPKGRVLLHAARVLYVIANEEHPDDA